MFDIEFTRRVLELDGSYSEYSVVDNAVARWRAVANTDTLPLAFINARDVTPAEHLEMQAVIQPCVDQAISKTINVPADFDYDVFRNLYQLAYDMGLKSCTAFRPNPVTGEIRWNGGRMICSALLQRGTRSRLNVSRSPTWWIFVIVRCQQENALMACGSRSQLLLPRHVLLANSSAESG